MATWLEDLLAATAELESPRKFILWSGLAAISAIVKNNVWITRYGGSDLLTVFPNVYVLLVAPSGHKKGVPVAIARGLVREAGGVREIAGRSSIEGILQDLGHARTTPGKRGPVIDSTAFIVSGEFSTALVRNPDALTILTDLHDGQFNKDWKNTLKHSGVDHLENVNITMLGGLNETHFNDMISEKEITGGFIARCQIVFSRKRERKNSLLRPPKSILSIKDLAQPLKKLVDLKGPFVMTEEAIVTYETWYNEFAPEKSSDKTGSAMRVHDHILKVAQLLALSREPKLEIIGDDIHGAIRLCLESTAKIETVTKGVGQSEMAVKQRAFLDAMLAEPAGKINRRKLLSRCRGDFDVHDLNRMEENFFAAGIIKEPYNGRVEGEKEKDAIYELTQKTIDEYSKG